MTKQRRLGVFLVVCSISAGLMVSVGVSSAPAETTVTFLAVGDISATAAASGVLTAMGQDSSDLSVALGDLSYGVAGQEQAWCDLVTSKLGAGYPFELIAGNHESSGTLNGNINDFSACLPNQLPGLIGTYGRQYYVDVPRAAPLFRYIMISPGLTFPDGIYSYGAGSPRYQWTSNAIDGARTAGIPWVVVGMHKPCISLGVYTCESGAELFNLLIGKKVDLVLGGHEHLYQRSKQLALTAGCATLTPGTYNAACVADPDSTLVKGAGMVQLTVGTGGVALRDVNAADSESGYFAASSGLNSNPSHGYLRVSATATELTGSFAPTDGSFVDSFTINTGSTPVNQPPVARFTSSCTNLVCTFNGSTSSDIDGTVDAYNWNFGDGSPAESGVNATHTYAAGGSYPVSLTVTDNLGAGSTPATSTVVVSSGTGPTYFARDDFNRTLTSGFGTATQGGAWTTAANSSVSAGSGAIRIAAGVAASPRLDSATAAGVDLTAVAWADKLPTAGSLYVNLIARRIAGVGDYRAAVRINEAGVVFAGVVRANAAGGETVIQAETKVAGVTVAAADKVRIRTRVTGSAPTTIQVKVWKDGSAEPAGWTRTVTDGTTGFQAAGSTGLRVYLSSATSNGPIVVRLDDWLAAVPQ